MTDRKLYIYFLAAMLALLAGLPRTLAAQEPALREIVVSNSDTDILLYLEVVNAFTAEMEEGIKNGIPATFTFYADVIRNRNGWPKTTVASHSFYHVLIFDSLKEEYQVEHSEFGGKIKTYKSFDKASKCMSEVRGFPLVSLKNLEPDSGYTLRVKARLSKKKLPLNFQYLIPLWGGDLETDYYTVEFNY